MTAAHSDRANRRIAFLAFGTAIALMVLIASLSPSPAGGERDTPPSTFYATDSGAKAMFQIFGRLVAETEQWRRPLTELSLHFNPQGATLVALGPQQPLNRDEADALDRWVAQGGQLILATNRAWEIRTSSGNHAERPVSEDYLERHGIQAKKETSAFAPGAAEEETIGLGRILYVPDRFAFSNQTLRETDNAVWLATRAAEWGDVVLFDEYHHGFASRRGFFSLIGAFLFSSAWGFVCLQAGLAGLVFVLGTKRRFGRVMDEPPPNRTSPIEAAAALGGLFEAAQARPLSARAIHQYLNTQLSTRMGHRIDLSDTEGRGWVAARSQVPPAELDSYAKTVSRALQSSETSDDDVLEIAVMATNILGSVHHGTAGTRKHAAAG